MNRRHYSNLLFLLKYQPIAVLLLLVIISTDKISAQDHELDSIKQLVDTHTIQDSVRVDLLVELTRYYTTRDFNESVPLIEEAIKISRDINYQKGLGRALNAYSTYYNLNGQLDSAISKALQAKKVLEQIGDTQNLLVTNSNLGRAYFTLKQHRKALEFHLDNIDLVKNDAPSSSKAGLYFYAGKTYQQIEDLENAEVYLLEALRISKAASFNTGIAIAEGALGVLYNQKGQYQKALQYLEKTLAFAQKYNQESNVAGAYVSMVKSYTGLGDYRQALAYNSKALAIYEKLANYNMLRDVYNNQFTLFEKLGDFKSSNEYLKKYYATVDTLFSRDRVQIMEDLRTKYETEKKEAEIASLSQQAMIQNLEIQQKNQWIIIGLIGFVLIGALAFLFTRSSAIQRQRAKTELEQRFLRSQLNPHFISNALLAVQQFMLKNDGNQASIYLAKFSKLMRQILENSRQEFITVEEEVQMLKDFMDIHQLKMGDAFQYEISVDEEIDPEMDAIPPMFIQPFVENAIEHGIDPEQKNGLIQINFRKTGEFISIDILDNGKGIDTATSKSNHRSLSTRIIEERIALFNKTLKNKIDLALGMNTNEQGESGGTRVQLKVPFSYG